MRYIKVIRVAATIYSFNVCLISKISHHSTGSSSLTLRGHILLLHELNSKTYAPTHNFMDIVTAPIPFYTMV